MTQINIADRPQRDWMQVRREDSDQPQPGTPERDAVANDNAERCRHSGVAIDPMFLN